MAKEKCKGSSNCSKPIVKDGLCADHIRQKANAAQQAATQKAQEKKSLEEGAAKRAEGAALHVKQAADKIAKAAEVARLATLWNAQVQTSVNQVLALRHANPKRTGINAGTNAGLATIPGGTGNPVSFVLPANKLEISKGDVYNAMKGFKGSDSGSFKFDVGGVFVHGH